MGASCPWVWDGLLMEGREDDGSCRAWSGGRVLGLTCCAFEARGYGSRAEEGSMSMGCDEEPRARGSALDRLPVCRADGFDAN
jgi:hypothetical protein